MWHRDWFKNKDWKSQECQKLVRRLLHGKGCPWRRRDNQSLEGKSLCILRPCIVSWESPSVPLIKRWVESQIGMVHAEKMDRIDGEPMEFEWMMNPGHTTLHILLEIQKLLKDLNCEREQLKGRIIFMSMYNDVVWRFTKWKSMSC